MIYMEGVMAKYHTNPMGDYSKNLKRKKKSVFPKTKRRKKKGCYVATCVYGSYDCPQVWTLRRFRDGVLENTWYGRLFIKLYYTISPVMVKLFGGTAMFSKICKPILDKFVSELNKNGFENTKYED